MTRRAFLLGRNTGSLRHCLAYDEATGALQPCDVQLMECCLTQHGFQVTLAEREADAGRVLNQLNAVIATCAQEDTFVFYFSGHSLTRQGAFYLVLANEKDHLNNLYFASQLIQQLRFCKAGSKLLILDCCVSICGVMAPAIFGVMTPPQRTEIRGSNAPQEWLFLAPFATGVGVGDDKGLGQR